MTVTTTKVKDSFVGDGVTAAFAFTFPTPAADWVTVEVDGVVVTATITLNLDQSTSPGGTATPLLVPADDTTVEVIRTVPLTQETRYSSYAAFPSSVHEAALDKLTMVAQELVVDAEADRASFASEVELLTSVAASEATARSASDAALAAAIAQARSDFSAGGGGFGDATAILASGSTLARSLASRFGSVLDIRDFFAGGRVAGVTDDAPALGAALQSGMARGIHTILIPERVYIGSHVSVEVYPDSGLRSSTGAAPPGGYQTFTYVISRNAGFEQLLVSRDFMLDAEIDAGPFQVFFGLTPRMSYASLFGRETGLVRPEWWGAAGDGATNDLPALLQSVGFAGGAGVLLRPVTYGLSYTGTAYAAGTTYANNAVATYAGKAYRSLQAANTGNQPDTSPTWWTPYELITIQSKRVVGHHNGATGASTLKVLAGSDVVGAVLSPKSAAAALADLQIDCNDLADHGVKYDGAHGTFADNVQVSNALSHGHYIKASQVCTFYRLTSLYCNGDGIRAEDSNGSRYYDCRAQLCDGNGISIVSELYSAGCSVYAPDIEDCDGHAIYVKNTTSKVDIFNAWIELPVGSGDALRVEGGKHVDVFGGRWTGSGSGTNRAVRIMSSSSTISSGISLHGLRCGGVGNANFNAIEVDDGQAMISVHDCLALVQIANSAATIIPVTGVGAGTARVFWDGRAVTFASAAPTGVQWLEGDVAWNTSVPAAGGVPRGWAADSSGTWVPIPGMAAARADSAAADVATLVTHFNDLLAKLRAAGVLKT